MEIHTTGHIIPHTGGTIHTILHTIVGTDLITLITDTIHIHTDTDTDMIITLPILITGDGTMVITMHHTIHDITEVDQDIPDIQVHH